MIAIRSHAENLEREIDFRPSFHCKITLQVQLARQVQAPLALQVPQAPEQPAWRQAPEQPAQARLARVSRQEPEPQALALPAWAQALEQEYRQPAIQAVVAELALVPNRSSASWYGSST